MPFNPIWSHALCNSAVSFFLTISITAFVSLPLLLVPWICNPYRTHGQFMIFYVDAHIILIEIHLIFPFYCRPYIITKYPNSITHHSLLSKISHNFSSKLKLLTLRSIRWIISKSISPHQCLDASTLPGAQQSKQQNKFNLYYE